MPQFKLKDENKQKIMRQIEFRNRLIQQRDQIQAQIDHETEFLNDIWKVACLSAQLSSDLSKECLIKDLIMPDGSVTAKIDQNGIASFDQVANGLQGAILGGEVKAETTENK